MFVFVFVLMAARTEGITATVKLCDYKINCFTENNLKYNASTAAASVVRNAAAVVSSIKSLCIKDEE